MSDALDDFDFTPTIEAIRPWMDSCHPDFYELRDEGQPDLLSQKIRFSKTLFAQFPEFLVLYLNSDELNAAFGHLEDIPSKPDQVLVQQEAFPHKRERERSIKRRAWRDSYEFALTRRETKQGLEFYQKQDQWKMVACLFREALESYVERFNKVVGTPVKNRTMCEYKKYFGEFNKSHDILGSIHIQGRDADPITHELWPILSFNLKDEEALSEKSIAKSLCMMFRQKAMSNNDEQHCPFGFALSDLSSIVLEHDENGDVYITDQRRPGALLYFLYEKAADILERSEKRKAILAKYISPVDHS